MGIERLGGLQSRRNRIIELVRLEEWAIRAESSYGTAESVFPDVSVGPQEQDAAYRPTLERRDR